MTLPGFTPWPPEVAERYRAAGYWRGEVLGDLTRHWARADGSRTAVVGGGRRIGYAELDRGADRIASGLVELGIRRHDRVVVQLPNVPEFLSVSLALFRVGALPVYALLAHRRAEIDYMCSAAGATGYIAPATHLGFDYRDLARQMISRHPGLRHVLMLGEAGEFTALAEVDREPRLLPPPDPADPAFFLLSGGTTGLPKLIPRTHDDYAFQLRGTAEAMGMGPDGAYLAALPVAHNAALGCPGALGTLAAGGKVVLASSPSPDEVFPLVEAEGVTLTTLMPPLVALWLDLADLVPADLSRLVIEVGGANLPADVARRVRPQLGARLSHWFGMAEGLLCFTRPDDPDEVVALTQGRPLCAADEIRVVDADERDVPAGEVGQLLARGPYTLRGYYAADQHNQIAFTPDGWFRTGDLVRVTAECNLVVEGRIKDVINRGGEKVSADEVEAQLLAHPRVRAVAVVPVPDGSLGEKTCAVLVPDGDPPTLRELRDFLSGRGLAEFKLPDRIELAEALPHTKVGKIDRGALRAALATGPQR